MRNEKKSTVSGKPVRRKVLFAVGITLPTAIAVALGIKNKDVIVRHFGELQEIVKKSAEYSSKWFSNLSDSDLLAEREKVRLRHCSGDESAWNLLRVIDEEIRKRESAIVPPSSWTPPVHREGGWYLFNDD